ncbi:hypothetical protein HMPREF2904_03080 [Streptococcus sp. HMSC072G04]|nr:hypothetical protein HMPREF2904_03080 [Streptococcus sp. HMSC072G04]
MIFFKVFEFFIASLLEVYLFFTYSILLIKNKSIKIYRKTIKKFFFTMILKIFYKKYIFLNKKYILFKISVL